MARVPPSYSENKQTCLTEEKTNIEPSLTTLELVAALIRQEMNKNKKDVGNNKIHIIRTTSSASIEKVTNKSPI